MSVKQRGFGSIQDPEVRRAMALKGSAASKAMGGGHHWTSQEARDASAKGLEARKAKKIQRARLAQQIQTDSPSEEM